MDRREKLEDFDVEINEELSDKDHYQHVLLDISGCVENANFRENHKAAEQLEDFLELFCSLLEDIQEFRDDNTNF